jgi:hypothetical protein
LFLGRGKEEEGKEEIFIARRERRAGGVSPSRNVAGAIVESSGV